MPLGKYPDFKSCKTAMIKKLGSEEKAAKYCGALYWKIHGKEEGTKILKKELLELKKVLLND